MFLKKKQNKKNTKLNFESNNYQMRDNYDTDKLVVANLEYISSDITPYGPMVKTTDQKYIFEMLNENDKIRYREIFTGFIADSSESGYFDLPYVVNIIPLKEQAPSVVESIPRYSLLLLLNEINTTKKVTKVKK
jgi:hypothetical protein